VTNLFVKISLLCNYKIWAGQSKFYLRSVFVMQVLSILYGLGSVFSIIFQCQFVAGPEGPHCINLMAFYLANGIIMVIIDCILYIMPIMMLWNVRIDRAKRFGMNILFLAGLM
jgi:predicted benzoate:H+ symporter BenE